MTDGHPYQIARRVLLDLHKVFLERGDQLWSVSPTGFHDIGIDEETARKALRLLATKKLVRYVATNSFVISDYGVSACDHPSTLERELPAPSEALPLGTSVPGGAASTTSSGPLDEYVPVALRDRFVAVCHLGSGSFSAVYEVQDRESLQRFALKVTRPDPDAKARAEREINALAKLHHNNVLGAVAVDSQGDWFILPLAEGTLGQLQSWGRLTPATALTLAWEVGSALAHAHAAGFVHRDLHVDNILRLDGAWMVADWGLTIARGQNRLTRTRSVGGNETWTAPEQLKSLRDADARSDLYSLGRIVEWLATGALPEPDRAGELRSGHPLAAFVNALTQLDRERRPPNAEAALAMLPPRTNPTSPPRTPDVPAISPLHLSPVSAVVLDRCRERHVARLEQVRSRREQTVALEDGPAIVLHVSPTGDAREFDLLPLKAEGFQPLPPIPHVHWQARFNHDGLVAYPQESPPVLQRLQLCRDGVIEFVDTYSVQRIHAPKQILFPLLLERDIVDFVEHWTQTILRRLGVPYPLVLCFGVTGVDGFELHIDDRPSLLPKSVFDRDTLSFRPVVLDGTQDIRRLLKPTFDALWQAAGEDRSLGYSPDGQWLDEPHPRR